jgi:hypothetical protein
MAAPALGVASFSSGQYTAEGSDAIGRTVECVNGIKVDLGVEKRLDSGGDVVGMIVAIFIMAVAAMAVVMVVVARHNNTYGW